MRSLWKTITVTGMRIVYCQMCVGDVAMFTMDNGAMDYHS